MIKLRADITIPVLLLLSAFCRPLSGETAPRLVDSLSVRASAGAWIYQNNASGNKAHEAGRAVLSVRRCLGEQFYARGGFEFSTAGSQSILQEALLGASLGMLEVSAGYRHFFYGNTSYYRSPGELEYFTRRGMLYESNGFGYVVSASPWRQVVLEQSATLNRNENAAVHLDGRQYAPC
jgi:hypothetical protein